MSDDLAEFWVHDTLVERKTGNGPSGPVLAAGIPVTGFVEQVVKLVRNATGVEVTSSATIYYPPGTAPIPAGSFITPPAALGGRRARVITCAVHDAGTLDLPEHVEVTVE